MGGTAGQIVFVTEDGSPVDEHQDEIDALMTEVGEVEHVSVAPSPFDDLSPGTRAADDSALIGQFQMDFPAGVDPAGSVDEITELVSETNSDVLEAHLGGQVLQSADIPFGAGEIIGVVVALIILTIVFRSLLPALIPIVTAIVGVGVSMLALVALSAGIDIPSVTTALGAMLGLAVGIDYALFILSRHRDQLSQGDDVHESIGKALATSGSAVIFAGMTVIIALVGLFITGIPFLTVMGVAAAATVALSVVVALTMLPAIMGILGERLRPRRIRRLMAENDGALPAPDPQATPPRSFGRTWVRLVTKVPALTILIVVVGVGALAIPIKDLELALPDLGTEPQGTAARDTYDVVAEEFGPGYNGPLLVTADIINTTDPLGVVDELESDVAALDDVKEIQMATPNQGADMAVVVVIPEGGPTDQSTKDLVAALRDSADGWERDLSISDVTVTGATAVGIDVTDKLSDALLPFGLFVVGLSLILLAMVFRSIWVPLKASVGYLFSVAAAFGVTSMVFEYGWFNGPLFVDVNGPVVSFMPIMVMGVLFGLAMDYEVFLVSRMREEYRAHRRCPGSDRAGLHRECAGRHRRRADHGRRVRRLRDLRLVHAAADRGRARRGRAGRRLRGADDVRAGRARPAGPARLVASGMDVPSAAHGRRRGRGLGRCARAPSLDRGARRPCPAPRGDRRPAAGGRRQHRPAHRVRRPRHPAGGPRP